MPTETVGLLHPGEMGAALGAAIREAGSHVAWCSDGRSEASRGRAEAAGLLEIGDLAALIGRSTTVVSVCPPHAALDVARAVAQLGFTGTYVDANAVSPATVMEIGDLVVQGGASFVDGGIIGGPPATRGATRVYLSGDSRTARGAASLLDGSPFDTVVLDAPPPAASALKICYAAWTKGGAALLLAVRSAAVALGVERDLLSEWRLSQPGLAERSETAKRSTEAKAWRFIFEMEEIASCFAAAGEPEGFHRAAADVYRRLAAPTPTLTRTGRPGARAPR